MRRMGDLLAATYPGRVFVLHDAPHFGSRASPPDSPPTLRASTAGCETACPAARQPGGARRRPAATPHARLRQPAAPWRSVRGQRTSQQRLSAGPHRQVGRSRVGPGVLHFARPLEAAGSDEARSARQNGARLRGPCARVLAAGMCPRRSTADRRAYLERRLDETKPILHHLRPPELLRPRRLRRSAGRHLARERDLPYLEIEVDFPFDANGPLRVRVEAFLEAQLMDDDLLNDDDSVRGGLTAMPALSDATGDSLSASLIRTALPGPHAATKRCTSAPPALHVPARAHGLARSLQARRDRPLGVVPVPHGAPRLVRHHPHDPRDRRRHPHRHRGARAPGGRGRPHAPGPRRVQLPPHRPGRGGERYACRAPDMCLGTTPLCLGKECLLEMLAVRHGVPFREIDVPLPPDEGEASPEVVADVAEQLRAASRGHRPLDRTQARPAQGPSSSPTGPRWPGATSCPSAWPDGWRWTAARPSPWSSWDRSSGAPGTAPGTSSGCSPSTAAAT